MGKSQIPYLQTNLDGSLDKEVVFPRIGFKSSTKWYLKPLFFIYDNNK